MVVFFLLLGGNGGFPPPPLFAPPPPPRVDFCPLALVVVKVVPVVVLLVVDFCFCVLYIAERKLIKAFKSVAWFYKTK